MAVNELKFSFTPTSGGYKKIQQEWAHAGVVGSGDLEILLTNDSKSADVLFDVKTKVIGYDGVWQAVLTRFAQRHNLGGMLFEINDNAATPAVVIKRLEQVIAAGGGLETGGTA
jgi:malonate decarboxylase delta subunit